MAGFDLAHGHWQPFKALGLSGTFWHVNPVILINTWVVLGIIGLLIIGARYALRKENSIGSYLVCSLGQILRNLVVQSLGTFHFGHFAFIASLFCFIFLCNTISLIPWLEEPTSDLNTTLGLAITAMVYAHISSIRARGIGAYLGHFIKPFVFMLPLNIVESFAKIVSLSFRLFGNIFGVAIISKLYLYAIGGSIPLEMLGIMSGLNILIILFFVIFDGGIQAFVFSMLSLTYLAIETHQEEHE